MAFRLVKKSFSLSGHRTSVALEPEFWAALAMMAQAGALSLARLVAQIDAGRGPDQPLASRLRVGVLSFAFSSARVPPGAEV